MSAGQDGEKTEAPSPKKLREARAKGQVAKSHEVVMSVTMFSAIASVWAARGKTSADLLALLNDCALIAKGDFSVGAPKAIALALTVVVRVLSPFLAVVAVSAVAANYLQIGSIFSLGAAQPKLSNVSPAAGAKRLFSKKQLVETLKAAIKIVFLSLLLFLLLRGAVGPFIQSLSCGLVCTADLTAALLERILMLSAGAFAIVAAADFAFQKSSYAKSMMMTKEEVKQEFKESEGDPHVKSKRKQLAQELIMGAEGEIARKSTAVVVNPTHYFVALLYKEDVTPLPVVVAKARDRRAHFLRAQAEEAGVPVFRNVTLARALYAQTEVDAFVPDELFAAVAEVLAWVARNKACLYQGPRRSGVIDMEAGDHRRPA